MPLYEYECKKCGHRFEKIQKFSDKMVKKCPECGGQVEQMISAPAVQFKGSGWYVTDYAKKSSSPGSSGNQDSSSSKDKKDDKPKTDGASKDSSKDGSAKESPSKEGSSKESSSKESSGKETSRKGSGRHK
jgi:putative FmdB family regulatory protein